MRNKTLDVGDPLDDESLKVHCTLDDVVAIADWLKDNKDSDVRMSYRLPGRKVLNKKNHCKCWKR